ncbi:ABC transporter substrate-binding protein [Haloferax marisrubri]|uniref:ABC transporter substrate-binding protein n=1 Tax=Haloferax marisrubri TaxID=1544719 RepID=A0A2P4NVL5_9EURY|nr:ABC transporter substrate-binding protein [Haloferax marisrubri]POG57191.1 ABC transporter substrate-binding protein [Haloferax marisrubri]
MANTADEHESPTRRDAIKGGGALIAGGLLAGCAGGSDAPTETATATETTATSSPTETTESMEPYTVSIEPSGSGTFEEVPETYATIPGVWMDIAMALGIPPKAVASFNRISLDYYDALPGVEFDADDVLTFGTDGESGNYDKEVLYEVDADVHLMDPRLLLRYSGWSDADLEEVESNIAPILGSFIRFPYGGENPYYTLYEAFEKGAEIFQRRAQYEAWVEFKDEVYADIRSRTPAESPTVAAFNFRFTPESGQFYGANIYAPRNDTRSFQLLGVEDAFPEGEYVPNNPIGYEELLEVDPDYIGCIGDLSYLSHEEFQGVIEAAQNHETLGTLTAVQEGNFVRTGGKRMGPIIDLFSAEATAKQLYPEEFGEWPGRVGDVPEDERLFDRQRMADIVNGEF